MKTRRGWLVKRGKTFYATWEINGKRFQRTTSQTDRRKAETELARIMEPFLVENDLRTLETVKARIEGAKATLAGIEAERNPPLALAAAWGAYLKAPNRRDSGKSTLCQYEYQFEAFARWADERPGVETLADVTPDIARDYAGHLAQTVSPATFNKHLALLSMVWRTLAKPGRVQSNPWAESEIGRKVAAPHSRRELTVDELRRVCGTAQGELRTLLAVGLYSGLRLGDAATLRWEETDLLRGVIRRIPNKTGRRNPKPVHVPIHSTLAAMLAETPETRRKGYILPGMAADYLHRRDAVTDIVQAHFRECGIETSKPGTGGDTGQRAVIEAGYHSLRHSFVSLCRAADVPLSVVESIVGHSSPAMTRHYTHTGEAAAAAAVAALPCVMGSEPKALPPGRTVDAAAVMAIAESMTAKTWKAARAALLELAKKGA
jgi:integrase